MKYRDRRRAASSHEGREPLRDRDDSACAPASTHSEAWAPSPPASGGVFVVDEASTILAFDAGMERLTGWSAFEVVGQQKDLGIYRNPDEVGVRAYALRPLYQGTLEWSPQARALELVLTRRDGVTLVVDATVAPVPGRLRRMSVHVNRVLERHGSAQSLIAPSDLDPVTSLPRGGVFLERLDTALHRARRESLPLSVLITDVDQIGEMQGHLGQGLRDEALRKISGILQASTREGDLVTRVRGDDFALLLEAANRGDARLVGGRIRRTVERLYFPGRGRGAYRVTVSIGAACYPADGKSAREIVTRAREALEEAHRLGSNRVWCYVRRPRVPARFPVFYDGPVGSLIGFTRDISDSGVFLETEDLMPIGTRLALALRLDQGPDLVRLVGRIARQVMPPESPAPAPGLGIEFESYEPEARRQLEEFLHTVVVNSR